MTAKACVPAFRQARCNTGLTHKFVDFLVGNELIDLDPVLAFDGDRFEFFGLDRNVLAFFCAL
jgi:hypothetical protein